MSYRSKEELEKIKDHRNETNIFGNAIGVHITDIGEGTATTEMVVTHMHSNPIGSVHGGCISTIADITAGSAASSHGMQVTTLDCNMHYLRAGLNSTKLIGRAKEVKAGKRVMVYDVSVEDQDGKVLATATYTFFSMGKEILG